MTTIPATFDGSTNIYTNNRNKPLTKSITSINKPNTTTVKNPNLLFRDSNSSVDPSKFIDVNSSGLKPGDGSTLIDTTSNKPVIRHNDEINTSFIQVPDHNTTILPQSVTSNTSFSPRQAGSSIYPKAVDSTKSKISHLRKEDSSTVKNDKNTSILLNTNKTNNDKNINDLLKGRTTVEEAKAGGVAAVKSLLENGYFNDGVVLVVTNTITGAHMTYSSKDDVPKNLRNSIISPKKYIEKYSK